ncbi:hypothetical protein EON64_09805 [archaeon]|nr:MAG: hypothetical protein EON64_09805 [archaeon]
MPTIILVIFYPLTANGGVFLSSLDRFGKTNGIPNEAINHSPDAVLASLYPSTFFVNEARKNSHKFSSADAEDKALIYNYKPAKTTGSFVESYFFKNSF